MKKTGQWISYLMIIMLGGILAACDSADDKVSAGSNFDIVEPEKLTALDQWIEENFVKPYNIEVSYRWESSLHDLSRYLSPPTADSVKPALEAVKQIWIDPYNAAGGQDFIKRIAPRQFVLVGGRNLPPNGVEIALLGLAEAGKRITLFEVDLLEKNPQDLQTFLHTVQHEYAHILDQTQPFDEANWIAISPEGYTSQWWQQTTPDSRNVGFISNYARSNVAEDFAETISYMLTRSKTAWDQLLGAISEKAGEEKIRKKERMLVDYYRTLGIDLYALQDSIHQATDRYLDNY